jgi:2-polyprenyl-3-methyl-5-hydroxy-6-metoxy-1,4-benzoquinol methylase
MTQLFDNLRDNYEDEICCAMRGFSGEHAFFIRIKAKKIEALAARFRGDSSRVNLLDVGCGSGLVEQFLRIPNAEITGLDVSEPLLEKARENVSGCQFTHFDGQSIDDEDNTYHLVFAINVFHHIAIKNRIQVLMEMWRVLRPEGILALFEHNSWHPITRFVVSRCSFDRDAMLLSRSNACSLLRTIGLHRINSSYMIFLPWSIGINRVLERVLGWLPLGTQYYVTGIK